ncbi:Nitrate reductase [NADH] [Sesamum angolense]|uniref:Nitrate reductase [NADH] n=1 Tax=Sesamum angolense TaxID=2727404 RepID=A0AAE1T4D3_9LAMI|nr:Nitrate reductase [NADH] [Sesamum angolense]
MAASVENRQFGRLEPGFQGVALPFKPGPTSHDSPVRGCSFPPSADITFPNNPNMNGNAIFDYSCSDEDDEDENDYLSAIKKAKAELEPSVLDSRDEATADNWVERNPSMVRLTGKHPFNAEPPLPRLMHHGFITPVPLHYVRNHGPVPKAVYNEWTVEVTGLVKRPMRLTMHQLETEFPSREFPVTLVCAGNRRKEQNMVKQTIGFNWGAAGISTSVWRGVPLRAILKRCGIMGKKKGALNVCFEGAEDLPGGGGSKYGTSVKKEIAMDPARDIILAYMQNGERLTPDHGFPVRVIIPGCIGGRMVKWLKRIIVTTQESDNYYHYKDNRVLQSHVDAELANAEAWWYKPEYIINELNINSVITTPCHEEILPINSWTTRGLTPCGDMPILKPNKYGKYWCGASGHWRWRCSDCSGPRRLRSERGMRPSTHTESSSGNAMYVTVILIGDDEQRWFRAKKLTYVQATQGEIGIRFKHNFSLATNLAGMDVAEERHLENLQRENQNLKRVSPPRS